MENIRITFIGCGNMGRSLIGGLINDGYPVNCISGVDINDAPRSLTHNHFGIEVLDNAAPALRGAHVVVLAVKPQAMKDTLVPLREIFSKEKPLLISIAAGIRLNDLARWAGDGLPIVRAMPNTPALVGTGASALCANSNVNDTQHDIAESIMRSTGIVTWVEDESLIDVVTALSGSGPAYYFYIMEIMEKAGIELGLTKEQARLLTLQTALGAAKMAMESEDDPEVLRKQVTSPGGTTEQAIKVMQEGKLNELFSKAIRAAFERSQELAKILGGDKQA
jgi:pyrroline-5-carboxylate reductase